MQMLEDRQEVLDDIVKRLSLRPPQAESLRRLAAAIEVAGLKKSVDAVTLEEQLAAVRVEFPQEQFPEINLPAATEFDWRFLSFSFALATGVGKTRLMGAIIAYLYRVKGLRNFVIVAPGKTIYEKLIADFTSGTRKYVFPGLACFATKKPVIVTGDTYQSGVGIMNDSDLLGYSVVVNIFNIQKLNERGDSHDESQKDIAKIRRLNERIGQSYFDYLKHCEDLVVLMDEAHHYRASAAAATIAELKPVLGIEMTATPRVGNKPFRNILCEYGLARAMKDGFVKEPAIVRRQNFRRDDYINRQDDLDRQKLKDAMIVHESTKAALVEYAFKNGVDKIKPFVLVVAPDTTYAGEIEAYLKSGDFYGGKYADKVIKVDYKTKGNNDEAIAQLLDIERPGNKIEIVIHVNMLSEGWDVTNLYTIVPLRAANSANLVEQTIGRGLRLPYGMRTGVAEIDTLSIVSHDKFDEIIAAAKDMQIAMKTRELPSRPKVTITAVPKVVAAREGIGNSPQAASASLTTATSDTARSVNRAILNAIGNIVENDIAGTGIDLSSETVRAQVANQVADTVLASNRASTENPTMDRESVARSVEVAFRMIKESMISIPRITISPGETTMKVMPFALDMEQIHYALRDDKLVYDYITDRRVRNVAGQAISAELSQGEIAGYIGDLVSEVANFNEIDYDENYEVIGNLCEDCINGLVAKLTPEAMANCMRNNLRSLAEGVKRQIMEHAEYAWDGDVEIVKEGPLILKANTLTIGKDEKPRRFDIPLAEGEKSRIRNMVFAGFSKCCFTLQKFESDPERAFSEMLEREQAVLKWFKPTLSNLRLWYGANEYTPDFVVETETNKLLCEVKAAQEIESAVVQAKLDAAVKWCHCANNQAVKNGDKIWRYLLVPDSAINSSLTLEQAIKSYGW